MLTPGRWRCLCSTEVGEQAPEMGNGVGGEGFSPLWGAGDREAIVQLEHHPAPGAVEGRNRSQANNIPHLWVGC